MENENIKICFGLWYDNREGVTKEVFPYNLFLKFTIAELKPIQKHNYYVFDRSFGEYVSVRGYFILKVSTFVFKKDLLEESGKFDPLLFTGEDVDLFFRMTTKSGVGIINNIHAIYFEGNDNISFLNSSLPKENEAIRNRKILHFSNLLKCYKKIKKMIKTSDELVNKKLLLRTNYRQIAELYLALSTLYKPTNLIAALYYNYRYRYYDKKHLKAQTKGKKYFYYSLKKRFPNEKIAFHEIANTIKNSTKRKSFLYLENHILVHESEFTISFYNPANEIQFHFDRVKFSRILENQAKGQLKVCARNLSDKYLLLLMKKIYSSQMGGLLLSEDEHINFFPENSPFTKARKDKIVSEWISSGRLI